MELIIMFMIGALFGATVVLIVYTLREKEAREVARELMSEVEHQKIQDLELLIGKIRDSFGALSLEALSRNTDEFLKLASETLSTQTKSGEKELEGKKQLIDQTLAVMKGNLENVESLVQTLEKDREQKFGELTSQLRHTSEETRKLQETAAQLKTALASTKVRCPAGCMNHRQVLP
jgi:DNA recombination protein RmuC